MKSAFQKFCGRLAAVLAVLVLCWSGSAYAAGDISVSFTITPSASSAVTNTSVTLVINVTTTSGGSNVPNANENVRPVIVSGAGNFSPASALTDANGNASFTLTASAAGAITLKGCDDTFGSCGISTSNTATVTFTAPASTPTPARTITPKTVTTAPASAPASTPTPPAAPTMAITQIGTTKLTETSAPVTIPQNKPLVLSGKTIANGILTLTIHSTPRTATVTADKDGNWTYKLTGLEPGTHHVEATVTDPATKLVSPPATLADFTVRAVKKVIPVATTTPAKKTTPVTLLAGIGILVVLAVLNIVLVLRKRRRSKALADPALSALASENVQAETKSDAQSDDSNLS